MLLRRVFPKFVQWSSGLDDYKPAVPSQGFQDYSAQVAIDQFDLPGACMSVAVEPILAEYGFTAKKMIEAYPGYGIAAVTAGAMRSLQGVQGTDWAQGVMWNPTGEEPWHAVVYCKNGKRKTPGMQSAIKAGALWVVLPTRPSGTA